MGRILQHRAVLLLARCACGLLLITAAGCTAARQSGPASSLHMDRVILDGKSVTTTHDDLLQFLQSRSAYFHLGANPLVLFDGVAMSRGAEALSNVYVRETVSVEVLRPGPATARYGSRAHDGAIVVHTKRGQRK